MKQIIIIIFISLSFLNVNSQNVNKYFIRTNHLADTKDELKKLGTILESNDEIITINNKERSNHYKNKIIIFIVFVGLIFSCKKTNLNEELLEGSWLFEKIEKQDETLLLTGKSEPRILFFFKENNELVGRLKGSYNVEKDNLYLQAEIDTIQNHFFGDFDLDRFPKRYYDFEAITKGGIQGKVIFYEKGWDSKFSIQYEENRTMWFKRY